MKEKMKIKLSVISFIAMFSLNACGPSPQQMSAASDACQNFVQEKMIIVKENTHVFDSWVKDGKIVVEVGYKEYPNNLKGDSFNTRLCVYDEEKGTISLPSIFNNSEWRK